MQYHNPAAAALPDFDPTIERLDGGRTHDQLSARDAAVIVDALNTALGDDAAPDRHGRLRFMQQQLLRLMGRDSDSELVLQDSDFAEGGVEPVRMLEHLGVGPNFDGIRLDRTISQHLVDECGGLRELGVLGALGHMHTPYTVVFSQDAAESAWFDDFRRRRLTPNGNTDVMVCYWLRQGRRLSSLSVYRREGERRFSKEDRIRLSLMTRAVAPVLDEQFYDKIDADEFGLDKLTPRQREVLTCLLRGLSEKEAAQALVVSTHTVHSHVKSLYATYDVTSRGELMAHFVDKRVRRLTGLAA